MKNAEREKAIELRSKGYSIKAISNKLSVAKSSVSTWVRHIELSDRDKNILRRNSYSRGVVEKRRLSRLANESKKRQIVIDQAMSEIPMIDRQTLWLIGTMLYWAEGGKTQRLVRFSNGDPEMIKIMMEFFRRVCEVPESKFRGYIHIHSQLNHKTAEKYWSELSNIRLEQFFKTYRKPNKSSQNKKSSLPNGVMDIYVMDTKLFYKITGWAEGVFSSY